PARTASATQVSLTMAPMTGRSLRLPQAPSVIFDEHVHLRGHFDALFPLPLRIRWCFVTAARPCVFIVAHPWRVPRAAERTCTPARVWRGCLSSRLATTGGTEKIAKPSVVARRSPRSIGQKRAARALPHRPLRTCRSSGSKHSSVPSRIQRHPLHEPPVPPPRPTPHAGVECGCDDTTTTASDTIPATTPTPVAAPT
ncbi:unnamed protein product, partial [Scytosiphon promiscuus]